MTNVVGHVTGNSSSKSVLRNLFMKSLGERDTEIQEVIHEILSLKLYNSSFKFQTKSLENSRGCEMTSDGVKGKKSHLHFYAQRISYGHELLSCNLVSC